MSILKRKNGTYQVRYRQDGKHCARTFRRKEDARQFESRLKATQEMRMDAEPDNNTIENHINFREFSDIWMTDHAEVYKTPSSVKKDRQMLRDYLIPFFGEISLNEIRKRDIIAFQSSLKSSSQLANKTINTITGTIQKMMSDAIAWEYASVNLIQGIKKLACHEHDINYWTKEDRDKFLSYAKLEDPKVYDLIAFTVHTGLRRGEVQGLMRDCLDFSHRAIIVKRNYCGQTRVLREYTKGKTIRIVPMNQIVFDIMIQFKDYPAIKTVFNFDFNNFVRLRFKPMQHKAGVRVITFHDLRHTFASHMIMGGATVFEVQNLLGHADIQTTMRYTHLAPDHLKGATDRLM